MLTGNGWAERFGVWLTVQVRKLALRRLAESSRVAFKLSDWSVWLGVQAVLSSLRRNDSRSQTSHKRSDLEDWLVVQSVRRGETPVSEGVLAAWEHMTWALVEICAKRGAPAGYLCAGWETCRDLGRTGSFRGVYVQRDEVVACSSEGRLRRAQPKRRDL